MADVFEDRLDRYKRARSTLNEVSGRSVEEQARAFRDIAAPPAELPTYPSAPQITTDELSKLFNEGIQFGAQPAAPEELGLVDEFTSGMSRAKQRIDQAWDIVRYEVGTKLLGMPDSIGLTDEELIKSLKEQQAELLETPMSVGASMGLQEIMGADGFGDILSKLIENPSSVAAILGESATYSIPILIAGLAGNIGGAASTIGTTLSASLNAGVMGGATTGLASYLVTAATEYADLLSQIASERDMDPNNVENIVKILQDPEARAEARDEASRYGLGVAAFDALSMGLAGRVGRLVTGSSKAAKAAAAAGKGISLGRAAATGAVEVGAQALAGGAGEATGQAFAGRPFGLVDVVLEGAMEVIPGIGEILTGMTFRAKPHVPNVEAVLEEEQPAGEAGIQTPVEPGGPQVPPPIEPGGPQVPPYMQPRTTGLSSNEQAQQASEILRAAPAQEAAPPQAAAPSLDEGFLPLTPTGRRPQETYKGKLQEVDKPTESLRKSLVEEYKNKNLLSSSLGDIVESGTADTEEQVTAEITDNAVKEAARLTAKSALSKVQEEAMVEAQADLGRLFTKEERAKFLGNKSWSDKLEELTKTAQEELANSNAGKELTEKQLDKIDTQAKKFEAAALVEEKARQKRLLRRMFKISRLAAFTETEPGKLQKKSAREQLRDLPNPILSSEEAAAAETRAEEIVRADKDAGLFRTQALEFLRKDSASSREALYGDEATLESVKKEGALGVEGTKYPGLTEAQIKRQQQKAQQTQLVAAGRELTSARNTREAAVKSTDVMKRPGLYQRAKAAEPKLFEKINWPAVEKEAEGRGSWDKKTLGMLAKRFGVLIGGPTPSTSKSTGEYYEGKPWLPKSRGSVEAAVMLVKAAQLKAQAAAIERVKNETREKIASAPRKAPSPESTLAENILEGRIDTKTHPDLAPLKKRRSVASKRETRRAIAAARRLLKPMRDEFKKPAVAREPAGGLEAVKPSQKLRTLEPKRGWQQTKDGLVKEVGDSTNPYATLRRYRIKKEENRFSLYMTVKRGVQTKKNQLLRSIDSVLVGTFQTLAKAKDAAASIRLRESESGELGYTFGETPDPSAPYSVFRDLAKKRGLSAAGSKMRLYFRLAQQESMLLGDFQPPVTDTMEARRVSVAEGSQKLAALQQRSSSASYMQKLAIASRNQEIQRALFEGKPIPEGNVSVESAPLESAPLESAPLENTTIGEEDQAAYSVEQTTIFDELARMQDGTKSEERARIINRLGSLLRIANTRIRFSNIEENGYYDTGENEIVISNKLGPAKRARVALHEITHSATHQALDNDAHLESLVTQIMQRANKLAAKTGKNWNFTDPHEFLAEAYSNTDFQNFLKSPEPRTLWTRLKDAILRALNRMGIPMRRNMWEDVVALEEATMPESVSSDVVKNRKLYSKEEATNRIQQAASSLIRDPAIGGRWRGFKYGLKSRVLLPLQTMRQLFTANSHYFNTDTGNAMKDYVSTVFMKEGEVHRYRSVIDDKIRHWQILQRKDGAQALIFNNVAHDSTIFDVDPTDSKAPKDGNAEAWKGVREQWKQLKPEWKKLFSDIREFYRKERSEVVHYLKANRLALLGTPENRLSDAETERLARTITDKKSFYEEMGKHVGEDKVLSDKKDLDRLWAQEYSVILHMAERTNYFPLKRFGDYVVTAATKGIAVNDGKPMTESEINKWKYDNPDAVIVDESDETNGRKSYQANYQHVEFFESNKDAEQAIIDLKNSGRYKEVSPVLLRNNDKLFDASSAQVLFNAVSNNPRADTRVINAVREALIELMPETSIRKAEMRRKNRAGASRDMMRGFAQYGLSASYYKAQLKYGRKLGRAMLAMKTIAKEAGKAGGDASKVPDRATAIQAVVNELNARDKIDGQNVISPNWAQAATNIGYLWYLVSPSYWMVNATQPWIVGLPYLGAKYGNAASSRAMISAMKTLGVTSSTLNALSPGGGKAGLTLQGQDEIFQRFGAITDKLRSINRNDLASMLEKLNEEGLIDLSFAMEIRNVAEGRLGDSKASKAWMWLQHFGRAMPHFIEVNNRTLMAVAAYNLEMQKSGNVEKATTAAKMAVAETQFDYSGANRPRYMGQQGLLGAATRPVMLFKMYAQHMYMLLGRAAMQSFRADTPEGRSEARKLFGLLTLSHSMAAGVLGGVAMEPLRLLLEAASMGLGSEDDPFDWERSANNALTDLLKTAGVGDSAAKTATQSILYGPIPGLHNRVGLQNLLFMGLQGQKAQDQFTNALVQIAGPLGGIGLNWARAYDAASLGNIPAALRLATPKLVRDFTRAAEFKTRGLETVYREQYMTPEEIGYASVFWQGLGFTPSGVAKTWRKRADITRLDRQLSTRRAYLMREYREATSGRARLEAIQAIREWNGVHRGTGYAISSKQVKQSRDTAAKREKTIRESGLPAYVDKKRLREIKNRVRY